MASAQICRFQKRISNLHAHHELSLRRHSDANQSYLTQSRDVMNSLLSTMTEDDKKFKKSKRISRSKTVQQHVSKSSRFGDLTSPASCHPSCGGFSQSGSQVESSDSEFFSLTLQMTVNHKRPNISESNRNRRCASRPFVHNEPIFPPPTYAEPTGSPFHVFPNTHSFRPHYNNSVLNYPVEVNGSSNAPLYHGHPACGQTSSFPLSSFETHLESGHSVHALPQAVDWQHVSRSIQDSDNAPPIRDRFYAYPASNSFDSCSSIQCNDNLWDSAFCSKNGSLFSRFPSSCHPEINPILAFTYPTTSGHRTDGLWKSNPFPQSQHNLNLHQQGIIPSDRYDFASGEPSDRLFSHPVEYG